MTHDEKKAWAKGVAARFAADSGLKVLSALPHGSWEYLVIRYELPKERWWQFWRPWVAKHRVNVPENSPA